MIATYWGHLKQPDKQEAARTASCRIRSRSCGLSAAGVTKIDGMAEALAKLALQPDKLEEADRSAEFNEQVDIAVLSAFIASERAEERQVGHTEGVQHGATVV